MASGAMVQENRLEYRSSLSGFLEYFLKSMRKRTWALRALWILWSGTT